MVHVFGSDGRAIEFRVSNSRSGSVMVQNLRVYAQLPCLDMCMQVGQFDYGR